MKADMDYVLRRQKEVFKLVSGRYPKYYLTGGTALAFYFKHRFSEDLDFFTRDYKRGELDKIMSVVSKTTGCKFHLEGEQSARGLVPMKVFYLRLKNGIPLKIDFVKDFCANIRPLNKGMHSLEDIYYRKIIAATGFQNKTDGAGKAVTGGRQSVKDLFDIYYLSENFMPLDGFLARFFPAAKSGSLAGWYRGFDRMEVKLELLRLIPGVDTRKVLRYMDKIILARDER